MLLAVAVLTATGALTARSDPGECLSDAEQELADLINQYRVDQGRPPVPISYWLCTVAQWHVWDLDVNDPALGDCNLHSWSDSRPDLWSEVCYLPDHSEAQGMWIKPREISDNVFTGYGFEIAYWSSGSASPAAALAAWQGSAPHNAVILGTGIWESYEPWPALGVGIFEGYAVAWFSGAGDPAGSMPPCAGSGIVSADPAPGAPSHLWVRPNPLDPTTRIAVDLATGGPVRVAVYDVQGRRIAAVFDGVLSAGRHTWSWPGNALGGGKTASGVYFVHLETPQATTGRRVVIAH
jgi:hypothetical protein